MNARTETLAEVIDWLGDEADREWERAKDGLSDGYGGFDAYTRAIQHCQDMIVEDEASSGKHAEIALLKHLADTFDERLRKAEQAKDGGSRLHVQRRPVGRLRVGGDLLPTHARTGTTARRKGTERCMISRNGSNQRAVRMMCAYSLSSGRFYV
ncbi:hypothetical protein [Bifidobacterium sp.]|uniref:hypothetical protein n=1 Tax=Bifidobacterium sp. TaxID=41200 RepID=UPI003D7DB0DB